MYTVYSTQNTEYYVKESICQFLRSRKTSRFILNHAAVGARVYGSMKMTSDGLIPIQGEVVTGRSLCLLGQDKDVITSPLIAVREVANPTVPEIEYPQTSPCVSVLFDTDEISDALGKVVSLAPLLSSDLEDSAQTKIIEVGDQ